MSKKEVERIRKMTFEELREELTYCENPVKNILIRKIMKEKYNQYLRRRNQLITKKQRKTLYEERKVATRKRKKKEMDDIIESLINNINEPEIELKEEDFNAKDVHGPLNELDDDYGLFDDKFKKEVAQDIMNNNLMERMNSELDIMSATKARKNNKDFIPPYANNEGDKYASFKHYRGISNNNFSSKRR